MNHIFHLDFFATRNEDDRHQLIMDCAGMIEATLKHFQLNRWRNAWWDPEDYKQELFVGAIKAVDTYEPCYNTKFSTHLYNRLNFHVLELFKEEKKWIQTDELLYEPMNRNPYHPYTEEQAESLVYNNLPESRQKAEIIIRHFEANETCVQLGERFHCSKSKIAYLIKDILAELRQRLQVETYNEDDYLFTSL